MSDKKSSGGSSFWIIFFWLIACWPVGIFLVIKKFAADRKAIMSGQTAVLFIMGWGLTAFGAGWFNLVLSQMLIENPIIENPNLRGLLYPILFLAGGIVLLSIASIIGKKATKYTGQTHQNFDASALTKYRNYIDIVVKDWYCSINNQAYGPYPENILRELIDRGQLTVDTYVYNNSPEDAPKGWQRAGDTEIAALFRNNSQGTQPLLSIQNQGPTRVSTEALKENVENRHRRFSGEGEAQTFSSNNAYEPGRRQFEEETRSFVDFSKKQIAGLVGSIVLFIGVFCPIVSIPMIGSINYSKGDGIIILVFAAISIIVTLIKKYEWLWFTGLGSLGVILFTFVNFQMKMSEMKSKLAGNPFSGLADVVLQSVQLQWGLGILIIGIILIIVAAILKEDTINEYRDEGGQFDAGIRSPYQNNQETRSFVNFSKKQIAGLVGLALALLTWRSQQSPAPTPIPAPTTAQTPTPDIDKKDAVYNITYSNAKLYKDLIGFVWVRAIVEITNEGASDLYLESSTLDLEDGRGSFVATLGHVSAYPKVISPGEKAYYYENTLFEDISANTVLTVVAHPKIYKAKIDNVRFPVTDVKSVINTDYHTREVSGRVENTSDKDESFLNVAIILFDASEKPIAVLSTFADVAAKDKAGFEATAQYLPDAEKFKAYAYPMFQFQF